MHKTSYRKPQTPQQQLSKAIDRAQADKITVAGEGKLVDGRRFWLVASQSVQGMHHVVTQQGKSLACDCIYSTMHGKVCVHRAAVYLSLRDAAIQAVNAARDVAESEGKQEGGPPEQPPHRQSMPAAQGQGSAPLAPMRQPAAAAAGGSSDQPDDATDMDYYASYASFYR